MNLEIIILSEISHTEDKMPYNTTYIWNLKNNASELIYKKQQQTQKTDLWLPRGRGWIREFGNSRCKLIEWIARSYCIS